MYEKYAMGQDELKPLTLEGKTVFGDMAATLVDSLDTLWMMGLKPEFDRHFSPSVEYMEICKREGSEKICILLSCLYQEPSGGPARWVEIERENSPARLFYITLGQDLQMKAAFSINALLHFSICNTSVEYKAVRLESKSHGCRARDWVAKNLNFDKKAKLSLFETTIRIVGGLLSAFDLSEDPMFLNKAQQLVDLLMPVFNASGKLF